MNKKKVQTGDLKRVLHAIRSYRPLLALAVLLAAGSVVLTLYMPILVGRAIDRIITSGQVDFSTIAGVLGKMAVLAVATAILQWFVETINNTVVSGVVRDTRNRAFIRLQNLPLRYIDSHAHGDILSRIVADVDQFADGLLLGFTQLFTGVLTIVGTLIFMLTIQPGITLAVVLLTPISLLVASFIAKRTYAMFHLQSTIRGEQTALISEMIGGQKLVRAFGYEPESQKRFDEIDERLSHASLRAIFFSSITNPSTRFVNSLVYVAVALMGALIAIGGGITVGGITAFLSYANQYTKPFNEISGVVAELQNALACAARVFALIEEEAQIPDAPDAIKLTDAKGNIAFDHVAFSYVPERPLIKDIQLTVAPGQRVAIVGPTGCGKTTLINLLMRFYDVNGGKILVDGQDIREMTRHSLRNSFGMVLQDTWLREGTIRDNIAMGNPDATQQEVEEAAKAAHAHSFIQQLPGGYQTILGPDGGSLSQGQKQMLCIARVMLCRPPMLILDEATSSIDTRTELHIQEAFARLMEGRTSFIVAHRLSTIKEADIILVMRDGDIVEQGNHDTLLAQGGFYAKLYESQFAR